MYLDLELNKLKKKIKELKPKTIFVELPEGLKTYFKEINQKLNDLNNNYDVFYSIEPVFGACDLQEDFAHNVNADLILHFGHREFIPIKFKNKNILYWPCFYKEEKTEIIDMVEKLKNEFDNKKISFIYPIQYQKIVEKLKNEIKSKTNISIIDGTNTNRTISGQVLGCDINTILPIIKDVDYVVYVGDGTFHNTAFINYPINKKVFWLYPFKEIIEIKPNIKETKRRNMLNFIIKDKKKFGIFITKKIGQENLKQALKIKEILEKNKKEVVLLVGDNVNYSKLIGFNLDVLVNTACPRIMDDFKNYDDLIIVNSIFIFNTFGR